MKSFNYASGFLSLKSLAHEQMKERKGNRMFFVSFRVFREPNK